MKVNTHIQHKRKGFTLVELLVVIAIIASLAGLSYGPIMKHLETSARTEAISNGKNIHSAMLGYMTANSNSFPDDAAVTLSGGTVGSTAEPYFQLLLTKGHMDDEKYFHSKQGAKVDLADSAEPDNDGTLDADENVWCYVASLSPSDGTSPFLMDSSEDGAEFLANTWKGKAIIIRVDGGAKARDLALGSTAVDPTDLGQSAVVNVDRGGTATNIIDTIPAYGEVKTPK